MPPAREQIYIEVVVLKPENAVQLSAKEVLALPCHYLMCQEIEKRMLLIEYLPGAEIATREQVIAIHLKAYGRKHKVVSHTVFDAVQPPQ